MLVLSSRVGAAAVLVGTSLALGVTPPATADPTCDPSGGGENSCARQPADTWPLAQGDFTSPGDPGWVYFTHPSHPADFPGGCGIGPDGTVGCDLVPPLEHPGASGPPGSYSCEGRRCPLPPPGTNQTVAGPQQPAEYVHSDVATFTRDVGELPAGHRLVNGNAWCVAGWQGAVSCVSGANGFTIAWWGGILEPPAG